MTAFVGESAIQTIDEETPSRMLSDSDLKEDELTSSDTECAQSHGHTSMDEEAIDGQDSVDEEAAKINDS